MQLVILLGGKATRLRLLAFATPKSLVNVLGKPFLFYMLLIYRKMGFTEYIFLTRGDAEQTTQFHSLMKKLPNFNYRLVEDRVLDGGTGRSLVDCVPGLKEKFWVVNGDSWFDDTESLSIDVNKINDDESISVIFTASPNSGDFANLSYMKDSNIVIDYKKNGLNTDRYSSQKNTTDAIDFGLIFLIKKDVEKFIKSNTQISLDMGELYLWLIRKNLLRSFSVLSDYIDIGTYKGWSLLSTKLANKK